MLVGAGEVDRPSKFKHQHSVDAVTNLLLELVGHIDHLVGRHMQGLALLQNEDSSDNRNN